ncbi:MAG: DUF7575 domain-containing protein [Gaiellaceae bacterium]
MARCPRCGGDVEERFRFCPWCASPQRTKMVEFFMPHPRDAGKALRVSRYLTKDPHVRFSVWSETECRGERGVATRIGSGSTCPLPAADQAAEVSARRSSMGSRNTTSS